MPSRSLQEWLGARAARLDEIENALRMVGGSGPGRRYATQQINQAYAVLVSSQFQGFCRDLHTECVRFLVQAVTPFRMQAVLQEEFALNRKLDRGNPNPGNIGSDFDRFGVEFWMEVEAHDLRNQQRKQLLAELNDWRNAIAHQDFDPSKLGGSMVLRLRRVRAWRGACNAVAVSFDEVMRAYIALVTRTSPW